MTTSTAQQIHEQRSNSARYSTNHVTVLQQKQSSHVAHLRVGVNTHAAMFTRSVARAYCTSSGRVLSILRSLFSPPSLRSTIVFFQRNVNFLLTASVCRHCTPDLEWYLFPLCRCGSDSFGRLRLLKVRLLSLYYRMLNFR